MASTLSQSAASGNSMVAIATLFAKTESGKERPLRQNDAEFDFHCEVKGQPEAIRVTELLQRPGVELKQSAGT